MKKFEYKSISHPGTDRKLIPTLNLLGSEGWELIAVEKIYLLFIVIDVRYYFKCELRE